MDFLNTFEYSWIFIAISACFYPPKPLKIAWDGHIFQAEELRLQRLAQQRQAALARRAAAQQRRLGAAAAALTRRLAAAEAARQAQQAQREALEAQQLVLAEEVRRWGFWLF